MSRLLPMLAHHNAEQVLAYRQHQPITARQFYADARALADRLPAQATVLNGCTDRYWFLVGLAAAMLRDHLSVLPHNHVPTTLAALRREFPDLVTLAGPAVEVPELPAITIDEQHTEPTAANSKPLAFAAEQICACLFTSGSTGEPAAYRRTWGMVVQSATAAAERLGLHPQKPTTILATVPAQHSYGFESSVMLALVAGGAFCAERPFYPADIVQSLHRLPRPSLLVTTPVHLRALIGARLSLPPVDMLLSATALLPRELAQQAEEHFRAPLQEIYGATETGQTASRRPVRESRWTPLSGVIFEEHDERCWARGSFIDGSVALSDYLDIGPDQRFRLIGRIADIVNVAGKRSSISHLNAQLTAIPGVEDGVFLLAESADDLTRLSAFVVAPGLTRAQILEQLRPRVEPAFMPRPLIQLEVIPRDGTGKATRRRLLDLLAAHGGAHRGESA